METPYLIFRNMSWTVIAKLSNRVGNAIISILISRMIGIVGSGTFSISQTYLIIGLSVASWGFDQILIREVGYNKKRLPLIYFNSVVLQILFGSIAALLVFIISFFTPYSCETNIMIRMLAFSIVPESVNIICLAVFYSLNKVKLVSILNTIFSFFKVLAVFVAISFERGLFTIGIVFLSISYFSMIINLLITRDYFPKNEIKINWKMGLLLLNNSLVIFLLSILYAVDNKIDTLTLSFISDEYTVGLYNAAIAITTFFFLFPQAYRDTIYPFFSRFYHSAGSSKILYSISLKILLLAILPIANGVSIFSSEIINLVFSDKFAAAAPLLSISVWVLPFYSLMSFNASFLIVNRKTNFMILYVGLSILSTLVLNLLLFPIIGLTASALIRVFSSVVVTAMFIRLVNNSMFKIKLTHTLIKSLGACFIMSLVIYTLKQNHLLISITLGFVTYLASLIIFKTFNKYDYLVFQSIISTIKKMVAR